MSREVRRVPLDYKHPVEHNPHWQIQSLPMPGHTPVPSRLHAKTERFIGLSSDYPGAVARWERNIAEVKAHEGFEWGWGVAYHLTGYKGHADAEPTTHLFYPEDAAEDEGITVRDEEHLEELLLAKLASEKPDPTGYLPVFDVPADELGWCLYQTTTEGAPVTPVFQTAAEMVEHLVNVGEDGEEIPYRREAAATLVSRGASIGTSFKVGEDGEVLDGARDVDKWPAAQS